MMATPTTTTGWILRVGSYAGIAGALLGLVGNLLHPATPIGDPEGVARTIAGSRLWVPDHLAIVLGLILMLGALAALFNILFAGVTFILYGLEPDLPSLAGMDRGPRRRRINPRRPDPGRRWRAHHDHQGPHHHLPHRDHPMVGGDEHSGPPQGTRAGTRHHSC